MLTQKLCRLTPDLPSKLPLQINQETRVEHLPWRSHSEFGNPVLFAHSFISYDKNMIRIPEHFSLKGIKAFVAGASHGIGHAITTGLAEAGAIPAMDGDWPAQSDINERFTGGRRGGPRGRAGG